MAPSVPSLSTYLTSCQVIQAAAKPVAFFPRTAHRVADYYKGNIFQVHSFNLWDSGACDWIQAFADGGQYENAVFMYYAPWDRASQEARSAVYSVAASEIGGALNCTFNGPFLV